VQTLARLGHHELSLSYAIAGARACPWAQKALYRAVAACHKLGRHRAALWFAIQVRSMHAYALLYWKHNGELRSGQPLRCTLYTMHVL
jgi:hypothetical protein